MKELHDAVSCKKNVPWKNPIQEESWRGYQEAGTLCETDGISHQDILQCLGGVRSAAASAPDGAILQLPTMDCPAEESHSFVMSLGPFVLHDQHTHRR